MTATPLFPGPATFPTAVRTALEAQDWPALIAALEAGVPANLKAGETTLLEAVFQASLVNAGTPRDLVPLPSSLLETFVRKGLDLTSEEDNPLELAVFYGQTLWARQLLDATWGAPLPARLLHTLIQGRAVRRNQAKREELEQAQAEAEAATQPPVRPRSREKVVTLRPMPVPESVLPHTPSIPATAESTQQIAQWVFLVDRLIEAGANLEEPMLVQALTWGEKSPFWRTPLLHAIAADDSAMATILLSLGASPNHRPGPTPWSPLAQALRCGNAGVLEALLEAGASLDVEQVEGKPFRAGHPLVQAVSMDVPGVLMRLGQAMTPEQRADIGWHAMHVAAAHDRVACMQALRRLGIGFDVRTPSSGFTPLHQAAQTGATEAIEFLLRRQQRWDTPNAAGVTAEAVLRAEHPELLARFELQPTSNVHWLAPRARR